jgi:high-affinity K+ transport system ATPase subunit B
MDAVFEDIFPEAVKIGMLCCEETMYAVAVVLKKWKTKNIILDPVMFIVNLYISWTTHLITIFFNKGEDFFERKRCKNRYMYLCR